MIGGEQVVSLCILECLSTEYDFEIRYEVSSNIVNKCVIHMTTNDNVKCESYTIGNNHIIPR